MVPLGFSGWHRGTDPQPLRCSGWRTPTSFPNTLLAARWRGSFSLGSLTTRASRTVQGPCTSSILPSCGLDFVRFWIAPALAVSRSISAIVVVTSAVDRGAGKILERAPRPPNLASLRQDLVRAVADMPSLQGSFELGESIPPDTAHVSYLYLSPMPKISSYLTSSYLCSGRECVAANVAVQHRL